MIISNSHQFIFIHTHNTGGTAISKELETSIQWNDLLITGSVNSNVQEHWYKTRFGIEMHSQAATVRDLVGREIWQSYYTFAFVRDPYRRILSLYLWLDDRVKARGFKSFERHIWPKKGIWGWPGTKAFIDSGNFSEFIRHPIIQANDALAALPMVNSLYEDGSLLVDFVGKYESLSKDTSHIREKVGITGSAVNRLNVTPSTVNLKDHYASQADLDLVYELYRADFDAFDYRKTQLSEL